MPIRNNVIALALGLGLLAACGKATTAEPETSAPTPDPKLAANPAYVSPTDYKTECMGRHLFDLPSSMEWAMVNPEKPYYPGSQFSKKIATQNDVWYYQRVLVSATPQTIYKLATVSAECRWYRRW